MSKCFTSPNLFWPSKSPNTGHINLHPLMLVYLKKIPMTFPLTSIPTKINFPLYSIIMWLKQCHKPPMTGNGNHTTYKHGEIWDGLSLFCQHYYILLPSECTFMLGTFIMVAQYYLLISHVGKNIYTYI